MNPGTGHSRGRWLYIAEYDTLFFSTFEYGSAGSEAGRNSVTVYEDVAADTVRVTRAAGIALVSTPEKGRT